MKNIVWIVIFLTVFLFPATACNDDDENDDNDIKSRDELIEECSEQCEHEYESCIEECSDEDECYRGIEYCEEFLTKCRDGCEDIPGPQ